MTQNSELKWDETGAQLRVCLCASLLIGPRWRHQVSIWSERSKGKRSPRWPGPRYETGTFAQFSAEVVTSWRPLPRPSRGRRCSGWPWCELGFVLQRRWLLWRWPPSLLPPHPGSIFKIPPAESHRCRRRVALPPSQWRRMTWIKSSSSSSSSSHYLPA